MIEPIIPAATKALTSLARAKMLLGIDAGDAGDDARLRMLIEFASAAAMEYCGREFARATWRETIAGPNRYGLMLTHTPVRSVSTVEFRSFGAAAWQAVTAFEIESPLVGLLRRTDAAVWSPSGHYRVTYEAGYDSLSEIPHALELGVIEIMKGLYFTTGEAARDPFIRQESIPDAASFSYGGSAGAGIPESAMTHLDKFRRVSIA